MSRVRGFGGILAIVVVIAVIVFAGAAFIASRGDDPDPEQGPVSPRDQPVGTGAGPAELVTTEGTQLLPPPDDFPALSGEEVRGSAVEVQSVSFDEGFWVGPGEDERVFVESDLDDRDGGFMPRTGDRLDLTGEIQEAPANAARRFRLSAQDGRLLQSQGAFIDADTVQPAGG